MNRPTSKRTGPARAIGAACAIALLLALIPLLAIASKPDAGLAADAANSGDPFENGDLSWDGNTQTYRIAGLGIRVGDIRESGRPGNAGPFPYPACLSRAYELSQQGVGGGNFPGWGISTFDYGSVAVTRNDRGISFSELPNWGWCAQSTNDTTIPDERDARLILVEEKSWWDEAAGIYHGCFALLVDNGHEHGVWDQATMGGAYVWADWQAYGKVRVEKSSSLPQMTDGNACYSLEGAEYGLYESREAADAREGAVATLATDAEGGAVSENLPPGTYFVRETKASPGYALDEKVHEVEVAGGQTSVLELGEVPQSNPVGIAAAKVDRETGEAAPQGSAALAGARFQVRYYDGVFRTAEEAESSGAPTRSWILATNEDGEARLDGESLVEGDALYTDSAGNPTLPLGTVLIQEIAAPEGYLLPDPNLVHIRTVEPEGAAEAVRSYSAPVNEESPARGGVALRKADAETPDGAAQGAATLDGAVFRIVNRSDHAVIVDGRRVEPGEPAADFATEDGAFETGSDLLPYGSYAIEEIGAPAGYLESDEVLEFSIGEDGQTVRFEGDGSYADQVKRGDLEFQKKDQASGAALGGVPFLITSETTGEAHVLVTDGNGYASTAAAWNAHSVRTNANDGAGGQGYDDAAGIWFAGTQGEGAPVDDARGALPYDTYTVEELPCAANQGRQLVVQSGLAITRDSETVDLGTIDDPRASLGTEALDAADGDHVLATDGAIRIIDRVMYAGLVPGRAYTVTGTLMDKGTGNPLDLGSGAIVAESSFTPESPNGTVEVAFEAELPPELAEDAGAAPSKEGDGAGATAESQDAAAPAGEMADATPAAGDEADGIEGQDGETGGSTEALGRLENGELGIVVFEEVRCDGRLVAEHGDLDDSGQSLLLAHTATPTPPDGTAPEPDGSAPAGRYDKTGYRALLPFALCAAAIVAGGGAVALGTATCRRGGKLRGGAPWARG